MSKTIQIPVHMPLTLPDNWQDCTTAQQLAYWILADFEEFKAGQATKEEIAQLSDACHANTVAIGNINITISGINGNITEIKADVGGLQTDVGGLQTDVGGLQTNVRGLQTNVGELQADVGALQADVGGLQTDVGGLQTDVGGLQTNVRGLQTNVGELQADVGALQADVTQLQGSTAEWINNPSNVVSSTAMFQTVTAVNNKVTVSDSLFTSTGHTMFVMVKGITTDITTGKVFEKTGAAVNYDSNVREIDVVSVPQNPVFLINCFTYSGRKILNVSTLSAFV